MLPMYLRYLGAEAYGLVGVFSVMQAWLSLLDMGMSPTLARQVALGRGKDSADSADSADLRSLLRSMEMVFLWLGIFIALGIGLAGPWIASHWLKVSTIPLSEVAYCISLMGVMIALRWFASLYRSGIQGMEQQVWLGAANIAVATLRYVAVLPLLWWVTQEPGHFFEFQLFTGVLELAVLMFKFYSLLPAGRPRERGFSISALKRVLPFTSGIAYSSAIWILLTQLDKAILSHVLPLKEYGYFSLVAVVANGVMSLAGPISQALLPRMTHLLAQGKEQEMLALYRKMTRLVVSVMLPITATIALFSSEILFAWTGDKEAAKWSGPVLTWFILGNGILTIGSFQYYLQYAHGKLKLHVTISTINAVLQLPILVYSALMYGALGVGISWFLSRVVAFFVWTAIVHRQFAPGLHNKWLLKDVAPLFGVTLIYFGLAAFLKNFLHDCGRIEIIVLAMTVGAFALAINMLIFFLNGSGRLKKFSWYRHA